MGNAYLYIRIESMAFMVRSVAMGSSATDPSLGQIMGKHCRVDAHRYSGVKFPRRESQPQCS